MKIQYRDKCTNNKNHQKIVATHIWSDYIDLAEDIRHSERGKNIFAAKSNNGASLCGRKRKARYAIYLHKKPAERAELGKAQVCCNELKKAGNVGIGMPCITALFFEYTAEN